MNNLKRWALVSALAFGGLWAQSTLAADRALIIGVGKYQDERSNLPGIDLDVGMMKEVVESLGFAPANIKTLLDQEATQENVRHTMERWLVEGAGPNDRVLIYYSGHGAQIPDEDGDEDDGADEVLTLHDLAVTRRGGKPTLSGVLVDDEFGRILDKISSKNVLVLIDACHSGTATRSIQLSTRSLGVDEAEEKFFDYPGMPLSTRSFKVEGRAGAAGGADHVAITATADNEKSLATRRGSVFTLGIKEAVIKAKSDGSRNLTPRAIWHATRNYVVSNVPAERRFTPQINGSNALMDQALTLAVTADGRGPAWRKVEELADGSGTVKILANKQTFYEGDKLVLRVQVPEDGYLNIVNVGPDDVSTVLFPNQYHKDNQVSAGTVTLPTDKMDFDLITRAPYGASLTVAVLTTQPINLFQNAEGQRDSKGNMLEDFGHLSERGLILIKTQKVKLRHNYHAGKLETRACQSASACN